MIASKTTLCALVCACTRVWVWDWALLAVESSIWVSTSVYFLGLYSAFFSLLHAAPVLSSSHSSAILCTAAWTLASSMQIQSLVPSLQLTLFSLITLPPFPPSSLGETPKEHCRLRSSMLSGRKKNGNIFDLMIIPSSCTWASCWTLRFRLITHTHKKLDITESKPKRPLGSHLLKQVVGTSCKSLSLQHCHCKYTAS